MPTYTFVCQRCGSSRDEVSSMEERDRLWVVCLCGCNMTREMVYNFSTKRDHAATWPENNNALVPTDQKLEAEYRAKGWLVPDPVDPRGETVRVESEAHFKHMLKQQGLKVKEDYEKYSRSQRHRTKPRKIKDRPDQKRARAKAEKELRERGIKLD